MRSGLLWFLVILSLVLILPYRLCWGQENGWIAAGIRAGTSFSDTSEDIDGYEIFATYGLPWNWPLTSGWKLSTRLNGAVGLLDGAGEESLVVSAGPSFALRRSGWRVSFDAGYKAAYITEEKFGRLDLGGSVQFIGHFSIRLDVVRNMAIGYSVQHMSNAGIYTENPGLNMHKIELLYLF